MPWSKPESEEIFTFRSINLGIRWNSRSAKGQVADKEASMTKAFVCFESDDITSIHYIVYCSIMSISCSARDRTSMTIRERQKAAPKLTLY